MLSWSVWWSIMGSSVVLSGIGFGDSLAIHTLYLIAMLGLESIDCSQFFCIPVEVL